MSARHWRCGRDYISRGKGYNRRGLGCGRCYNPALLGHSLGSTLHLEPSPLRPGGRQPYSGAPSGGGGCRPFFSLSLPRFFDAVIGASL